MPEVNNFDLEQALEGSRLLQNTILQFVYAMKNRWVVDPMLFFSRKQKEGAFRNSHGLLLDKMANATQSLLMAPELVALADPEEQKRPVLRPLIEMPVSEAVKWLGVYGIIPLNVGAVESISLEHARGSLYYLSLVPTEKGWPVFYKGKMHGFLEEDSKIDCDYVIPVEDFGNLQLPSYLQRPNRGIRLELVPCNCHNGFEPHGDGRVRGDACTKCGGTGNFVKGSEVAGGSTLIELQNQALKLGNNLIPLAEGVMDKLKGTGKNWTGVHEMGPTATNLARDLEHALNHWREDQVRFRDEKTEEYIVRLYKLGSRLFAAILAGGGGEYNFVAGLPEQLPVRNWAAELVQSPAGAAILVKALTK